METIKALCVYFELCLVHPSLHGQYIKQEFGGEDKFWNTLESTGIDLPYVKSTVS